MQIEELQNLLDSCNKTSDFIRTLSEVFNTYVEELKQDRKASDYASNHYEYSIEAYTEVYELLVLCARKLRSIGD